MTKFFHAILAALVLMILTQGALSAEEAKLKASVSAMPLRYAFVHGDEAKFRELQWSRENYTGGIESFSLEEANHLEDVEVEIDGHAIPGNNDYEATAEIKKNNFGYVKLEYKEFSKYFDDTGAHYYRFNELASVYLGRDLELEIGHLRVETGLTLEDLPELIFIYERHFKDGTKSRLTYGAVREGGLTRNIAPSFQEIDEIVDTITLEQKYEIKEFEIKGEQTWEWLESELTREEQNFSNTTTASDKKIRVQNQQPESQLFSTTESIQRWFYGEKVFTGLAYHFLTMETSEVEDIFEMNETRSVINFTNPKQVRNARANSEYDAHTWVTNLMIAPWNWFNVVTNLRSELMERSGNSAYPQDTTPVNATPDGIINNTELSQSRDKAGRIGEGISLRFNLPFRTALYNDFELEQISNWLGEDRDSLAGQSTPNTNEIFSRETITRTNRGIWTLGIHAEPHPMIDATAHIRYHRNNSDYDDTNETQPGATAAKSAFFDALNIETQEFATRITFKPHRRIRPSFRYSLQLRDYNSRVEDEGAVTTEMDSHVFSFDLALQPLDNLLIVSSVSPQYALISTPTRFYGGVGFPTYHADVVSWLTQVTYDLNEHVSFLGGLNFSHADNFEDYTWIGLPLGVAYRLFDLTFGVNWKLNEYLSVQTDYGYYHYNAADSIDTGSYNANVLTTKTIVNWG